MGENLEVAKWSLESALKMLDALPSGGIPLDERRDIRIKIQMGLNALTQNEKAIWLKTKKGKDILTEFHEASAKLKDTVERFDDETSSKFLEGVKAALMDVETGTKKINEETRRRSMVVT